MPDKKSPFEQLAEAIMDPALALAPPQPEGVYILQQGYDREGGAILGVSPDLEILLAHALNARKELTTIDEKWTQHPDSEDYVRWWTSAWYWQTITYHTFEGA